MSSPLDSHMRFRAAVVVGHFESEVADVEARGTMVSDSCSLDLEILQLGWQKRRRRLKNAARVLGLCSASLRRAGEGKGRLEYKNENKRQKSGSRLSQR